MYPHTLTPCRALDTREAFATGPVTGALTLNAGSTDCGLPPDAEAYLANATAVPSGALSYLTLWPDAQAQPFVSTLNSLDGKVTSNLAIVPTSNGLIDLFVTDPTHLIVDIAGYFAH